MSEARMRSKVVAAMKCLHAKPIENSCGIGTPDVNFAGGWLELKWHRRWPKRKDAYFSLVHKLTDEQRIWLHDRNNLEFENIFVLLQVEKDWFLIPPELFPHGPLNQTLLETVSLLHSRDLQAIVQHLAEDVLP